MPNVQKTVSNPCEAIIIMTIIIMANPKMWSVQAATTSIRPILSHPALNIDYRAEPNWCFMDASTNCGAESLMEREFFGEGCGVSSHNDKLLHAGLREPMLQSPMFRVHYSST
jgi:hypothetical protein